MFYIVSEMLLSEYGMEWCAVQCAYGSLVDNFLLLLLSAIVGFFFSLPAQQIPRFHLSIQLNFAFISVFEISKHMHYFA